MLRTTPVLNGSLAFFPGVTTCILVCGSSMASGGQKSFDSETLELTNDETKIQENWLEKN